MSGEDILKESLIFERTRNKLKQRALLRGGA
jgi:hypothetical protein